MKKIIIGSLIAAGLLLGTGNAHADTAPMPGPTPADTAPPPAPDDWLRMTQQAQVDWDAAPRGLSLGGLPLPHLRFKPCPVPDPAP